MSIYWWEVTSVSWRRGRRGLGGNAYYRASLELLNQLGLPKTFTLADLKRAIESHLGKTIYIIARPMPATGPTGLSIGAMQGEYVFYAEDAKPLQRTVIIGHEFGHILFDGHTPPANRQDLLATVLPERSIVGITRLAARTYWTSDRERRAEVFGSVVAARVVGWGDLPPPGTDLAVLARLIAALETDQPHV
jgi:hypothetical protein